MKYALIGCGRIAVNHIKAAQNTGLEIVAICDTNPLAIEKMIGQFDILGNNTKCYLDYNEMINNNSIDLISIATDSGKHAEIALACIEKNINIIIEKPIAMNMRDANLIIEKSAEKKVKVSVCHQNRFNLAVQEMRDAVESGRFGKLSHGSICVRWNRNEQYYQQAQWRGKWESDGGTLMNQCIHGIDLLRWMMGEEIEEVYGTTRQQFHNYIETEDVGIGIVKFKNGTIATIEGTVNVFPNNLEETLCIFGENGTVKLGGKSTNSIEVWNFKDSIGKDISNQNLYEETSNVYGNGHTSLFADVIDSIKNDRTPYVDAVAGKNALEVVLAIYMSQKYNKPVSFPIEDFGTLEMIDAHF